MLTYCNSEKNAGLVLAGLGIVGLVATFDIIAERRGAVYLASIQSR